MTTKEKARAYDEAIRKAAALYKASEPMSGCNVIIETLFPELKESEDEKIREALIRFHKSTIDIDGIKGADIISWLKKQGEQKPIINVPSREIILAIWDLGNEWKELTNGSISTEYGTQLNYIQSHWHESEYYLRAMQNKQKPTDKVEPKFKVGDWVIDKQGIVHQISNVIENVTNNTYAYDTVGGGYFNDNTEGVRLWTIQDAKDGDVLYINNTMSESIMIYKSFNNGVTNKYASYNKFGFEGENYLTLNDGYIIPATKEQRNLLFQKMKDAGYEWDVKNRELKKIEQKPADEEMKILLRSEYEKGRADVIAEIQKEWGEEDIIHLNNCISYMSRLDSSEMDWLKSLKGRVQPKQEWSEEDEKKRKCLIKGLEDRMGFGWASDPFSREEYINWLKSLRPQNRWKPSERQLVCLQDAIEHYNLMGSPATTLNEILKQMRKLKEGKV